MNVVTSTLVWRRFVVVARLQSVITFRRVSTITQHGVHVCLRIHQLFKKESKIFAGAPSTSNGNKKLTLSVLSVLRRAGRFFVSVGALTSAVWTIWLFFPRLKEVEAFWKSQLRKKTLFAAFSGGGLWTSLPLFEARKTAWRATGMRPCLFWGWALMSDVTLFKWTICELGSKVAKVIRSSDSTVSRMIALPMNVALMSSSNNKEHQEVPAGIGRGGVWPRRS